MRFRQRVADALRELGRPGVQQSVQLKQSLPACPLCKVPLIKEPDGESGVTHLGVSGGVQMTRSGTPPGVAA